MPPKKVIKIKDSVSLAELVNGVIPLHKVGVNWFGRCIFCADEGSHFLVPHHGRYWQCLRCNKKGTGVPEK
jgi:DNA primase